MHGPLLAHIAKFVALSDAEQEILCAAIRVETFAKKELMLREGQHCDRHFFILKGCCRMYIVNEKGNEQTLQFAIENWWVTDYLSVQNQAPSHFNLQATEPLTAIVMGQEILEKLLEQIPKLERYFRLGLQKSFGAAQMRIKFLFTMNAQQRYENMSRAFPEFVQRVPQYMLASYLDFSPELLSKIRAGKH